MARKDANSLKLKKLDCLMRYFLNKKLKGHVFSYRERR